MVWDYIVVGQGLAGSILSYYLLSHNRTVLVFDDPARPKSSSVAAGIYNPFTGRKLVKTWMVDQLFPFLDKFYDKLQHDLGQKLLHRVPMYRPFLSQEEQNEWGARAHELGYEQYIDRIIPAKNAIEGVINPLGGMMLTKCGYLDIEPLLLLMSEVLKEKQCLQLEKFQPSDLEIHKDSVSYRGIRARRVIFCEGTSVAGNKYFDWLPLRPVKGEILQIELDKPLDFIVNRGVFVLPLSGKTCKVGATFDNKDLSHDITAQAKSRLQAKLDRLIGIPYRVTDQMAGIRPASADRRPLIGLHPEFEPLGVINGLGTKGVSLAPYFVKEFFEFLEKGRPLSPSVALNRHFSLYYNKI